MTESDKKKMKEDRQKDVDVILNDPSDKKIVVAGPGTGKSHLFKELIKKEKEKRKKDDLDVLAITFIGKLKDSLADDLCGLADTRTLHSFAREQFLNHTTGYVYYPEMKDIITEDLENDSIKKFEIGDVNYKKRTTYYKAVGKDDIVHYTVSLFNEDDSKIPQYDLVLIDEFQDFNEKEAELVHLLASKNKIVIVGDDDQSLYGFKDAKPDYIISAFKNTSFKSYKLKFCSRCTNVLIEAFHTIVDTFKSTLTDRIDKDYICYVPDKEDDSKLAPNIIHSYVKPTCFAKFIKEELSLLVKKTKIKDVLVIAEAQTSKSILKQTCNLLKNKGFVNVSAPDSATDISLKSKSVSAYDFLSKDKKSKIGWRLLENPSDDDIKNKHLENANTYKILITGTPSKIKQISMLKIKKLMHEIAENFENIKSSKTISDICKEKVGKTKPKLSAPLQNLNITVCSILGSKGLGADVVFLIQFDKGILPKTNTPSKEEILQFLVALTRAKKSMYLVSTAKTYNAPSIFIKPLKAKNLIQFKAYPSKT